MSAATAPAAEAAPLLRLHGVSKRFGGIVALDRVDFALYPGEIHALCGENGAGKSTLIKLLSGVHRHGSFSGDYELDGRPAELRGRADATAAGIAVIYQELLLVGGMSVAENIFLGAEPRRGPRGLLVDHDRMRREARELLSRFGIAIDPAARVDALGVGQKQLVEIAKALSKQSRILILDEPTAALSSHETAILLELLRALRQKGVASIYISHKLEEVFAVADRITVLRDGRSVAALDREEVRAADAQVIIRHMVGREIRDLYPRRPPHPPGEVLLSVRNLTVAPGPRAPARLCDVSLQVRAGEVLGVGGLMGAGRSELLMHLLGAWGVRRGGSVELGGQPCPPWQPVDALARGLVLVSEERRRYGLVMDASVSFNLSLSSLRQVVRRGLGILDGGAERARNLRTAARLRIKAPSLATLVRGLSGGNQQKVVLGKALLTAPRVVLLDEPTRGIDVGAKREVYELINELCAAGMAVLMVSSELPELIGMSDRMLMLRDGRVQGEFAGAAATPEALLAAALGRAPAAAASEELS